MVPPAPKLIIDESVPWKVKLLLTTNVLLLDTVNVVVPAPGLVIVKLLIDVAVATPNTGVIKVGVLAKTRLPVPVSSVITLRS